MDTPITGVITNDYEIQCIGKIKNYIESIERKKAYEKTI